MTETRIRWEYADGGMDGYVGALVPPVFRICDAAPSRATWCLMAEFPGDAILSDDMEALKAKAERWLEEFIASLGAVFPEPGFEFEDDGEPLEVKYAPGRRVRYVHPDYGYPGEQEPAAELLVLGGVYTIEWADIGQSRTDLNLRGLPGERFNSVFFELADDEDSSLLAAKEGD